MERRIKGMNHLLSIIVPVYNVKKHLNNSVNSILQQSYQNIELLLIDDGSSDGSSDLCDENAKKDHRVSVIHQENQGVSAARNTGIDNSNGDLISFADADDLLDLDMYELLIGTLDEADADVSASAYAYERNPDKVQVLTNHDCVPKPMIFKGGCRFMRV